MNLKEKKKDGSKNAKTFCVEITQTKIHVYVKK